MISLRLYQQKLVDALRGAFLAGYVSLLLQLPTGGGKTFVFSYVADGASKKGKRVLILVHRKELLTQASLSLAKIGLRHSLIAQDKHIREAIGLHVEEFSNTFVDMAARVIIASVDTLIRRLCMAEVPDLIICDEGHHATKKNKWGKIIAYFKTKNPDLRILFVTATPARADGMGLGVDSDGFADYLVVGPSPRELIDMGFLLQPVVYAPPSGLDLTGVRTKDGEWNASDLEARVDKPTITGSAVEHYRRICPKVPAIVFCVSIAHATHVAAEFRAGGFDFRVIDGTMHDTERRNLIRALARGHIDGLTSCDIISEGTDIPVVGCGILLRPTKSEGLFLQQVGRVLRPSPGQARAFILDHVGNCFIHGLPDEEREWTLDGRKKRKKGDGKAEPRVPVLQCPKCYSAHAPAPACPQCGHVYENGGRQVEQKDGHLQEITGEAAEILRSKRKADLRRIRSFEDAQEYGKSQGYKPGWAKHYWQKKKSRAPLAGTTF